MANPYEMWAWLVEEEPGDEGIIAAYVTDHSGPLPLHSRRKDFALRMEGIARQHGRQYGRPVRLVHLVEVPE